MARARLVGEAKARAKNRDVRVATQARKGKNTATMDGCRAVSPDKPLTDKQKAFVRELGKGEAPPNALLRAGFSDCNPAYAYRLMAMPNIQRALAAEKEANARAAELSRRDVMDMLKEAYDMAKLMSEPASMVSAAREIGKMCGYYEPRKVELTVSHGKQKVEQLSDEELFKLIEEASSEVQALTHADADDA